MTVCFDLRFADMDMETGGLVTMSYQPLTEMKIPTFDEMELKVEQVIAKIAQVTKQHKADVQVCVDCADGLLEVAQVRTHQTSADLPYSKKVVWAGGKI